ncbi:MAG: LamG-like jellyroll fold domain-containing protein [Pirellulales bacterium]
MSEYLELDRLLSRYLDGSATAADMATLEATLAADEQFAEHFARWCLAHRQIADLHTESKLHDLMDQFATSSPGLPKEAFRERRERSVGGGGGGGGGGKWLLAWAVLAGALVSVAAWLIVDRSGRQIVDPTVAKTEAEPAGTEPVVTATLTQIVDGVWAAGAPVLHHGQLLHVGDQVALASGMVKVTYDCGAEVVLEGPCDYWLHNRMEGYLASGRITANVPRRAFSFAILSPQVDLVDLGTSFGVEVGANGRTELHVFEGEVLCSEPSKQQAGQRNEVIHVTANKAMEFRAEAGQPSDIAMNQEQFARLIALRRAADVEAGHLTEDKLALWLSADVAVTTDAANRVISWQDIVYGDNASGEDAIQVDEKARPLLVKDGINGRPAIRFDGESDYLLTTPLETTDDQTVMFVCQFGPQAFRPGRKWGGQVINYDGPPNRYLSDTSKPGVLQIGEPLLEQEFKPSLFTGQVFAGFIGSATVESGRVDAAPVGPEAPVIVAYVYDYEYEHGKSYLMINGRKYGEARAFAPQGITSRKIIGRHAWMELYFGGDLAEMLIYNKALTPEELAQTTAYLADKYAIPLDE